MGASDISVLVISSYMICPPISGGAKRMLFPALNMKEEDHFSFTYVYLSYTVTEALHNKYYLEQFPNIKKTCSVVTSVDFQFDQNNMPGFFSEEVWRTINRDLLSASIRELQSGHYDIVHIIHSQLAWIVPHLRQGTDAKFVMDCQNLEWLVYKRWMDYVDPDIYGSVRNNYLNLKNWEEKIFSWFDAIFCISNIEKRIVQDYCGDAKLYYVPSGASIDDDLYYPPPKAPKPYDLFFIGSMNWFPNAHALTWLLDKVMPLVLDIRPDTKLEIIGSGDPDQEMIKRIKKYPNATFWGALEDERRFFHGSKVFVSPIWIGAGVRLKNPTAWATKLPIVATTLSVEGLEYTPGHDILIGDTPEEFAGQIIKLLGSAQYREELAENGYETYRQTYSLNKLVDIWKNAYKDTLTLHNGPQ